MFTCPLLSKLFTSQNQSAIIEAEWTSKPSFSNNTKGAVYIMLNAEGIANNEFLEYKGKPLVRQGDDIFYGDLSGKHYVYMMVMGDKKTSTGEEVPGTIMVQLLESATKKPIKQKITNGLAEAFEFAEAWLR